MSAKKSRQGARQPVVSTSAPAPAPAPAPTPAATLTAAEPAAPSWLDSTEPRKRLWGKIILAAVWLYVGALWLLALDQTFHWGIFGPKLPPLP